LQNINMPREPQGRQRRTGRRRIYLPRSTSLRERLKERYARLELGRDRALNERVCFRLETSLSSKKLG
jgi:hypothetical protein